MLWTSMFNQTLNRTMKGLNVSGFSTFPVTKPAKINRRRATKLIFSTAAAVALSPVSIIGASAQSSTKRMAELAAPGPMGNRVLGNPDAPVTIIEYASMTCPHCAAFHANILPSIKKNYLDTGKAKLIFRDFPLDDLAIVVSMIAHCIKGDAYFAFVNILFEQQRAWAAAPKAELTKLAKQAGITEGNFDKCIANQDVLNGIGWERKRAKNDFGVESTPTVFVNGQKMHAGATVAEYQSVIDAAL